MKTLALPAFYLLVLWNALAQDMRKVTEPVIPPPCTTLAAKLSAQGTTLAEADERKLDTRRIQDALDGCAAGKAVVLKSGSAYNAFNSASSASGVLQ